jgi:hypothetical protein
MLLERGTASPWLWESDRGCPPGTVRVRLIWHAGGTTDEGTASRSSGIATAHPTARRILVAAVLLNEVRLDVTVTVG